MTSVLLINLTLLAAIIGIANSVGLYEQCAGDGYGTFPCNAGLTCFRRNTGYSSCQFSCPRNQGWECEIGLPVVPVTTISAGWDQCGGDGWYGPSVCEAGYGCYARSVFYSQCRPIGDCPPGWTCTPVTPITIAAGFGQCGGNGWAGASVCATGYGCYAQNALYSQCRPIGDCPTGWACTPVTPITIAAGFGQCGGSGWAGASVCAAGYGCYAQNALYSQCRPFGDCPAGWSCTPVTVPTTVSPTVGPTGPVILGVYSQCNNVGYAVCPVGTGCFRNNANYAECRPYCPVGWACETDVALVNGQCGGQDYVGTTRCAAGLACYAQNALYSQCRPVGDCPAGWGCTPIIVPTTAYPTVGPTGPVILGVNSQCNNVGYAVCPAGTGCFRSNANYSECRYYCPVGWACETDVAGLNEQCGGQDYVGTTRCAAGLACYAQNALYSQCRPVGDCPTGWGCTSIIVPTTAYPTVGPTGPVILAVNSQCNNVGYAVCPAGTGCFRSNANYSECRYYCPVGWACETDVAGLNEQCGGQDYVGITSCAAGYGCYAQNALYSQCRLIGDCPTGWACTPIVVPTTAYPTVSPTVSPTGPAILAVNSQCNNVVNAVCPVGTGCFRSTAIYSECRYFCPVGWACETDVVGENEQCGGEDYVGITSCAAGLTCYARSKYFSHCAAECPGVGWLC